MTQQKQKLSLTDFLKDKSLGGGSWADDDDFDPSSISLPTHSHNPRGNDYLSYQGNSHNVFGNAHGSRFNAGPQGPTSPPFIVKFTNIPSTFTLGDVEDLFQSRFMRFAKLKLFWDIDFGILQSSPNPLDAINQRKKVAFVELESYQDSEKVLKWTDLFLGRGMGRLMVHVGNFNDFKTYNDLNQKVPENLDPSLPLQHNQSRFGPSSAPPRRERTSSFNQPHEFVHAPSAFSQHNQTLPDSVTHHQIKPHQPHELPPLIQPKPATLSKSSPFGKAKPVDILKKELEIEEQLHDLQVNTTTFKTLGGLERKNQAKAQAQAKNQAKTQAKDKQENAAVPKESKESKSSQSASKETSPADSKSVSPAIHNQKLTFKKQDLSKSQTTKPHSLVPAPTPEVQAWSSAPILSASSTNSSQNTSPTQGFSKLASPSLAEKRLKNETASNLAKQDKGKKTILRRKTTDQKKTKIVLKKDDSAKVESANGNDANEVHPATQNTNDEVSLSSSEKTDVDSTTKDVVIEPKSTTIKESTGQPEPRKGKNQQRKDQSSASVTPPQGGSDQATETPTEKNSKPEDNPEIRRHERSIQGAEGTNLKGGRGRGRGRGKERIRALHERVWVRNPDNTANDSNRSSTPKADKPDQTNIEKPVKDVSNEPAAKTANESPTATDQTITEGVKSDTPETTSGSFRGGRGRGRGGRGRGLRGPRGPGGYGNLSRVYNRKDGSDGQGNSGTATYNTNAVTNSTPDS